MSNTKTQDREQTTVPPVQPDAKPIAKTEAQQSRKEGWENFKVELDKRADEIGSQLPPNVTRDRFVGASLAAVKANPDILSATPRSLFSALIKAAQDGLLPDGREGIITVFSTKIPNSNPERYENVAQWNPMFYGIRKRARELDGIIIDAQVVIEGDEFDYELGDEPRIHHKPKARAEVMDASKGIAVYAIFRHPEQGILHREVMWKPEVFAVMNQSRAKTSLMWTKFWTEGWRKTVGRRGSKSVPVSPQLERLIQRDDENFDFPKSPVMIAAPTPPPAPKAIEADPLHNSDQPEGGKSEVADHSSDLPKMVQPEDDLTNDDSSVSTEPEDTTLEKLEFWCAGAKSTHDIYEAWADLGIEAEFLEGSPDRAAAERIRTKHMDRINREIIVAGGMGDLLGDDPKPPSAPVDDSFPGDRPTPKAPRG